MQQMKELMVKIVTQGQDRETRTGLCRSTWKHSLAFDLQEGFPALTSKKLAWNSVVGELLWFLSGSSDLKDLRHYTFGNGGIDKWTIWTDDAARWNKEINGEDADDVGELYPLQWRNYNNAGVDQIGKLIHGLINNPFNRDHIVMAWNPETIHYNRTALKPCHIGFQCYVTNDGKLNLHWWQRSVDTFLGLGFNIASYALLTHLLAHWTDLEVGMLTADLGDVHIYHNHFDAVNTYLTNPEYPIPQLSLPMTTYIDLEECLNHTAVDLKDALTGYQHAGIIKAPLSVGDLK